MSDLKPCAHCGNDPIIMHKIGSYANTIWQIVCPFCGIRTHENGNKSELIITWNRRVEDEND